MEGRKMKQKEISYDQAIKTIKQGKAVKCQHSNREDQYEIVHTITQLNNLYELSKQGVQICKLYSIPQKKEKLSEDVIELNFDEAFNAVATGEKVFFQNEDGEEEEITKTNELVRLRRANEAMGKKLNLYWHE